MHPSHRFRGRKKAMEIQYEKTSFGRALISKEDFGEKPTRSPDRRSTSVGAVSLHFSESLVIRQPFTFIQGNETYRCKDM